MSRLFRFVHSATSSYMLLISNACYTLLSVPLVLKYLSKDGFGVWAVLSQVVMYMLVVDSGLTPSISRMIIDVKDDQGHDAYSGVVWTSWLTQAGAGIIIVAIGFLVIPFAGAFFHVPVELSNDFLLLAKYQILLVGIQFITKVFDQILTAHQREYLVNYAQIIYFVVAFLGLYVSLKNGFGLLSMVISNAVAWGVSWLFKVFACIFAGVLPRMIRMRFLHLNVFNELFVLSRDTFLTVLGSNLIMASQVLLVSRILGIGAAATWAIATRFFYFAGHIVWRLFDASVPALAEMMVRGERSRLSDRFRSLVQLTGICGVLVAYSFAFLNQPFLQIWTEGEISWWRGNDILVAIWLLVLSLTHSHGVFIMITKKIRGMRYIYFLEGLSFLVSGSIVTHYFGMAGMILCSIFCSLFFHGFYVYRRTAEYFNVSKYEVIIGWQKQALIAFLLLGILIVPVGYITRGISSVGQIAINLSIVTIVGGTLLLKHIKSLSKCG